MLASSFLISFDSGIYSVAGFGVAGMVNLFRTSRASSSFKPMMHLFAETLAGLLGWVRVINLFMGKVFDFTFWRFGLEIVRNYRWFEPVGMLAPRPFTWILSRQPASNKCPRTKCG
jgi:hypothetical protein